MSYLFVEGVAAGGFVLPPAAGAELSDWLQPVNNAPNTKPNSTISVDIRFIVGVTFTKTPKRTSKILNPRFWWGSTPDCRSLPNQLRCPLPRPHNQIPIHPQIPKTEVRQPALLLPQQLTRTPQL